MGKNEVSDNEAASEQDHADPELKEMMNDPKFDILTHLSIKDTICGIIRSSGPQTDEQLHIKVKSVLEDGIMGVTTTMKIMLKTGDLLKITKVPTLYSLPQYDSENNQLAAKILDIIKSIGPQAGYQLVRKVNVSSKDLHEMLTLLINEGSLVMQEGRINLYSLPQDDSEENHRARDRESHRRDSPTKPPMNRLLMSSHKLKRKKL